MVPTRAAIVALSIVVAGCGSTVATQVTAPGDVACAVNATAPQQLLASGGDRITVAMTTSRDCLWNVVVAASWLQVSPPSGQGGGALVFTATANPGSDPRVATVSVNGTPLTVVQAGMATSPAPTPASSPPMVSPEPVVPPTSVSPPAPVVSCTPLVSPTAVGLGGDGGSGVIGVSVAAGCRWSATSTAGWITITSGSTGTGPGGVAFSVGKHNGKGGRTGSLVVAGVTVTVSQDGGKD